MADEAKAITEELAEKVGQFEWDLKRILKRLRQIGEDGRFGDSEKLSNLLNEIALEWHCLRRRYGWPEEEEGD